MSTELRDRSYKELQALAKQHGISAKQKATELIAALTPILNVSSTAAKSKKKAGGRAASPAPAPTVEDDPMEVDTPEEEAPKPKSRARGGRTKKKQQQQQQDDDAQSVAVSEATSVAGRKRSSAHAQLDSSENAEPAAAAESRKSKKSAANTTASSSSAQNEEQAASRKSKKSTANNTAREEHESAASRKSKKSSAAQNDSSAAMEDVRAPVKDRVTKRGRRAKRVTDVEPVASRRASQVAEEPVARTSLNTPAAASSSSSQPASRRGSAQTAAAQAVLAGRRTKSPAAATPSGDGTFVSPVHPRPSIAGGQPARRKTWTKLPIELFGAVAVPPSQVAPPPNRLSGGHPTANAPAHLRQDYAARHSTERFSSGGPNVSPSKRGGTAMLEAARRMSDPRSPTSSSAVPATPRQVAAYSPAFTLGSGTANASALPGSSLSQLSSPRPIVPVPPARNKDQTAARLSFTRFPGPGQPQVVIPGAFDPTKGFTTGIAAAPSNRPGHAGAKGKPIGRGTTPAAAAAGKSNLFSLKAHTAASLAPTAAASSSSSNLFSSTQRNIPLPSPPRASFSATHSNLSSLPRPSGSPSNTTAAAAAAGTAAARTKFDLAASLQRPVGWQMKKGVVKPIVNASSSTVVTSNLTRTTQLKTAVILSSKANRQAAAQQNTVTARQNKLNQARSRM